MTLARGVLRVLVGAVFVAAAAGKIAGDGGTRIAPVLLGAGSGIAGMSAAVAEDAMPWLELLAGLATWVGLGRVARGMLAIVLGASFTAVALLMPDGVRCGCFGVLGELPSRAAHVAMAFAVLLASAALLWLELRKDCDPKSLLSKDLGKLSKETGSPGHK